MDPRFQLHTKAHSMSVNYVVSPVRHADLTRHARSRLQKVRVHRAQVEPVLTLSALEDDSLDYFIPAVREQIRTVLKEGFL